MQSISIKSLILLLATNFYFLFQIFFIPDAGMLFLPVLILALGIFLFLNIKPVFTKYPTIQLNTMASGNELILLFLITLWGNVILSVLYLILGFFSNAGLRVSLLHFAILTGAESILFWNGIIRIYATSLQLGIKWRILGIIFAWIPIVNIITLIKLYKLVAAEVEFELEKWEINEIRKEREICSTKYPILMVHGVFFRDIRFFNYWGRIPKELMRNGATVFYGNQQSAESVASCGMELAERIRNIVAETGCEKVNIIAHSKGGLDSRYAVSCCDVAPYVATLTTINTPHRGCIFADYLLDKIPENVKNSVSHTYNVTLQKLGDAHPDFLAAVSDLTSSKCQIFNENVPDMPGIYYQSVQSVMKRATSGKFPLNIAYPLVKYFDGENDGLVALESGKWGSDFIMLQPTGKRGISHGDMIDLNRENVQGFDVRDFYVNLVAKLKERGY